MDISKALRNAMNTGQVILGTDKSLRAVSENKAKMVIVASNCPPDTVAQLDDAKVPVVKFTGTNIGLGSACGKPFSVSILSIIDPGESEILEIANE